MTPPMERRQFIATCAAGGAALLLGGCVAMVTHPVPMQAGRIRLQLAAYPDLGKPNGAIKILPSGAAEPIYVLATDSAEYQALSPICTHRGCTVDVQGPRLVCPCHGSTYDRDGTVLRGPAERPLTRYAVTREGDTLVIEVRS